MKVREDKAAGECFPSYKQTADRLVCYPRIPDESGTVLPTACQSIMEGGTH